LWAYINDAIQDTSIVDVDNLIILGDYNITFDMHDLYDSSMEGGIFASTQERHFFTQLSSLGMVDAYRHLYPQKYIYTWWDYRMSSFKRNMGLRIDHIWVGRKITPQLTQCTLHRNMRELERPSDHAPLSIDI
jgi:exodeoxyribonuclease III